VADWCRLYSGSVAAYLLYAISITKWWLQPHERIPYIFITVALTGTLNTLFGGNVGTASGNHGAVPQTLSGINQWTGSLPFIATLSTFMAHLIMLVLRGWPLKTYATVAQGEEGAIGMELENTTLEN
jgi:hypothetical protein